jgi:hypothetical protein
MSAMLSPAVAALPSPRMLHRLEELVETWRALGRRHWIVALGTGGLVGLGYGLHFFTRMVPEPPYLAVFAFVMVHMTLMNGVGAVLVVLSVSALERPTRRDAPRPAAYARAIALVALFMGVLDNLGQWGVQSLIRAFGLRLEVWEAASTWHGIVLMAFGSALQHLIALLPATLCYVYLRHAWRTAERLASARLRHAEVERRLLAEQLAGAQALVEPAFLLDTLELAKQRFESDPGEGQRLLDELIAYLRAALPPLSGGGSTLGQQVELLRAYLQIERIRFDGGLNPRIDVPAELADEPFAPLLLMPLAVHAVRHGIGPNGGGDVMVRAWVAEGRLVVEVADSGPARAEAMRHSPVLAELRGLLARLYGRGARLLLVDRAASGFASRLELAARASA